MRLPERTVTQSLDRPFAETKPAAVPNKKQHDSIVTSVCLKSSLGGKGDHPIAGDQGLQPILSVVFKQMETEMSFRNIQRKALPNGLISRGKA